MSDEELMQKVAGLLRPVVEDAARKEVGGRMKDLPGIVKKEPEDLPSIVRSEMDACIDGKCDAIANRVIEKLPEFPKGDVPVDYKEDLAKAVQEIMANTKPTISVEGHTAHDILDCPTCKPIVIDTLWKDEGYRQKVMESICEDDACRASISKMFEDKGYGVKENVGTNETWAERRLRERAERKAE